MVTRRCHWVLIPYWRPQRRRNTGVHRIVRDLKRLQSEIKLTQDIIRQLERDVNVASDLRWSDVLSQSTLPAADENDFVAPHQLQSALQPTASNDLVLTQRP